MATALPTLPNQWLDTNGQPLAGGLIYTYDAGTSTPRTTWADSGEFVPNSNPIVLDGNGTATVFWRGNYRIEVRRADNSLVRSIDLVDGLAPTASPTFTGLVTAAGGQIAFPATQIPSANVNTLDDYEEGSFTPVDASGAGLVLTPSAGLYVKIGKLVWVSFSVTYPVTANGANASIGGFPYTSDANNFARGTLAIGYRSLGLIPTSCLVEASSTACFLFNGASLATNANVSGNNLFFSGIYLAAQ